MWKPQFWPRFPHFFPATKKKNEDNRLEIQERVDKSLCFHYEARISQKEPTEN